MVWLPRILVPCLLGISPLSVQGEASSEARALPVAIESAWRDLDSPDRSLREAARGIIEAAPFEMWRSRALEETRSRASIEALLALCHACPAKQWPELRPHLCESITTLRIEQMNAEQTLAAIRLTRLVCTRLGAPSDDERRQMLDLWSHFLAAIADQARHGRPVSPGADGKREAAVALEIQELLTLLSSDARK